MNYVHKNALNQGTMFSREKKRTALKNVRKDTLMGIIKLLDGRIPKSEWENDTNVLNILLQSVIVYQKILFMIVDLHFFMIDWLKYFYSDDINKSF